MCGIAGYAHPGRDAAPIENSRLALSMAQTLAHRGPDEQGAWHDAQVALGHRRLCVIDPAHGQQPMRLDAHGLATVWNGEIYNFQQLNDELATLGLPSRVRSDTDTLLRAYAAWGEGCLTRLRGMFGLVIYDRSNHRLLAARDPLGKKPFYYVHRGGFFGFASESKALLAHPRVSRELDPHALALYLQLGHVPAPYAIYRDMRKLEPGQCLSLDLQTGELTVNTYWDMADALHAAGAAPAIDERQWARRVREGLLEAVGRRLVADVPLGVFLSGGVDSTAVAAAMVRQLEPGRVKTFSIGFDDPRFDESSAARETADYLGTQHHEQRISEAQMLDLLPQVVELLDEPFADPSILPTFALARFAREHVTVALGGDGGDELFAGYPTFLAQPVASLYNRLVPGLLHRQVMQPLVGSLPAGDGYFSLAFKGQQFLRGVKCPDAERIARWVGISGKEEVAQLLRPELVAQAQLDELDAPSIALHAKVAGLDPVARDSYLLARLYLAEGVLVKVDRATMGASLEARSPLMDVDFVALAQSAPSGLKRKGRRLKHLLKEAVAPWVAPGMLDRPKHGFAAPTAAWLRGPLRSEVQRLLVEPADDALLNLDAVRPLVAEHMAGRRDHRRLLWSLMMLQRWRERWGG